MALRMMSAIVPGHNAIDINQGCDHAAERQKLLEDLLAAVKKCHIRFGGRVELATESDICVKQLCHTFELIFSHGLRTNCIEKLNSALRHVSDIVSGSNTKLCNTADVAFWPCIKEQLTWHEQERFSILKKVHTDYGRGRAWLRAVLNERSLERHLHAIINPDTLVPFYEEWGFLLDQERSAVLPNVAAGLGSILFAIRVDNEELDDTLRGKEIEKQRVSQSEPIISSGVPGPPTSKQQKQRKKVQTHIISFDNEDEIQEIKGATDSSSAPSTCLNSPTVTTDKESVSSSLSTSQSQISIANDVNTVVNTVVPEWEKSISNESLEEEDKVLNPISSSSNMGGLVPVSPLDQPLDDMLIALPNYLGDSADVTEAAIEATEPLASLDSQGDVENLDIENLDENTLRVKLLDAMTSRLQLVRLQRQHQDCLERHDLQLQTLNRENELLRQQLRKYVTAVQMLRRDSDSTTVSEEDPSLDYHNEAQQYQEKLIQVADMHAELMEFNSRLILQLTNRDRLVKLLKAELECLRGPLNEEDLPLEPPNLIHIWIPSAFLTGQPSDIHHVYQIYVRIRDTEWNIYRRYAQFYALYRELKKHDAIVAFEFPPKKTIGNKDAKFVEERRQKLQQWLRRIVWRLAQCSPAFSSMPTRQTLISLMPFFGDNPNTEESRKSNSTRNTFSSSPQYMGL